MSSNKNIRIFNPQKFEVGIKTQAYPLGFTIMPKSFAMVSEEDVEYINSISTVFTRGVLRLDKENNDLLRVVGIDVDTNPHYADEEMIRKHLSGSAKALTEWLGQITEDYVLDKVFNVAKEMNLPANKIKVLSAKMPDRDFIG